MSVQNTQAVQTDSSGMYKKAGEELGGMDASKVNPGDEAGKLAAEKQLNAAAESDAKSNTESNAKNVSTATDADIQNEAKQAKEEEKEQKAKDQEEETKKAEDTGLDAAGSVASV